MPIRKTGETAGLLNFMYKHGYGFLQQVSRFIKKYKTGGTEIRSKTGRNKNEYKLRRDKPGYKI